MTCGCSSLETSQLLTGGSKKRTLTKGKKKSVTKKSVTKKSATKKSVTKKSATKKTSKGKKRMSGGGDISEYLTGTKIPLRVQSSPDWHMPGTSTSPPYAIDLGEAMQSYLFGRPTPNGKDFMVASGLVERSKNVIDMVGGKKRTTSKKKSIVSKKKKSVSKKKRTVSKKKRITKK
jgi:hypothetical protein